MTTYAELCGLKNVPSEEHLIDRAERAYLRRFGKWEPQPGHAHNEVVVDEDDTIYVLLGNVNGELCRYRYNPKQNRLALVS